MTVGPAATRAAADDADATERHFTAGSCRLRVLGGTGDATAIAGQLGARQADPGLPPDVTIAVRPLARGPRRLFGTGEYAAVDEGLVLLRGDGKRPVEVLVPFDRLGQQPTLVASPGSAPLPLLVSIVNATALSKGVLPLHAAAFDLDGLGVLVTGWSRSGKTETLLAFRPHGGHYVGDEWVYVHPDGTLTGLQEPMRVWTWHLRELDGATPTLPLGTRISLALLDRAAAAGGPDITRRLPDKVRRFRHLLSEQRNVRLPPQQLLPVLDRTQLDVIVLTESHDDPDITVTPISSSLVADRLAPMLPVERAPLATAYQVYRYAFPDRRSQLLDEAETLERRLLTDRLVDRPALLVRHPYPFHFDAMADALLPWLERFR
jgi:hypothetical protein